MKKNELRVQYKQKRKDLTNSQKKELELNIYQQVFNLEVKNIKNIHLFLSMKKFNEIDTTPIIKFFKGLDKKIIVSKCNFHDDSLTHYLLDKNTILELNKFGVPEPVNAKEINVKEIDLVFVPLLISDMKKYRVGYGKGFYDRFLATCKKEVKTIGINFFKPIDSIDDLNKYDIPLDKVIYPQ
ncbi:5-formyltetrahydrofolate cyclo-ligase [Tenacibaculum sp. nBUS_03]|uniref:5-formyltetrahydrofolate cyclo-ligase n=1 Tax=Tenacibaculum sp. nBUS_03 TaxID=3395320 RepID=UPI003EB876D6